MSDTGRPAQNAPQQPAQQPPAAQPAPAAPMPWDDQQRQLDAMKANLTNLDQARHRAYDAWAAIKDAPIDNSGTAYATPGSVTDQAKTQALNAYTSSEQKYAQALSDMGALSTDIATAKQKYQDEQDKLHPSPETAAKIAADTKAAEAQSGYYGAQANEAQARADYLTSPEGKAKDTAAAKLDEARAVTEKAQQDYYGAQQTYLGAQTTEANANAALTTAKATAYPGESAASVASANAQAAASTAETALHEEELRQKRLGDLGAFIDSMATAQKAGLIDQATAEQLVKAKEQALLTGATQFDQQKQADANMTTLAQQALQSGNAVRPDQQYMVGGGPGGDIAAALGNLGIQFTPTKLQPATMPAYAASLGVTTPASVAAANAAPAYAAGLMGPEIVHTTPQQVMAEMQAAKAATPSTASLAPGNVPQGQPPGTVMGGVGNGLALTAPIAGTGAPLPPDAAALAASTPNYRR